MIHLPELQPWRDRYAELPLEPLVVTLYLQPGSQVVTFTPVCLDNLLAWSVVQRATNGRGLPDDADDGYWLPLPLKMAWADAGGFPLWDCSVLQPATDYALDTSYYHKRAVSGTLSRPRKLLTNVGRHMERREPLRSIAACNTWRAYCIGNADAIADLLKDVAFIGKRRAAGAATVKEWHVDPAPDGGFQSAITRDGKLARAMPADAFGALGLPVAPTAQYTLVGWTPPQWKPALWRLGWEAGAEIPVDFFSMAGVE